MANSKYEYVRSFEQPDALLSNTWIVVRIDGRGFSKFTTKYEFLKPNDRQALDLMNAAAEAVMKELQDLVLAYGNSDEYSFVFHKDCNLFERRASKLVTTIVSTFTSYYVFLWSNYFPEKPLTPPLPSFDGRAVCYPSDLNLRDYMSWRQADCHINNLYNTTFWALVQKGGMDPRSAEQRLSGTVSSDKNEILFKQFGINYNNEPECFKKGTVLYRDFSSSTTTDTFMSSTLSAFPSPPMTHPQPRQTSPNHTTSQPEIGTDIRYDPRNEYDVTKRGPGLSFLSTSSTPSPPLSPSIVSIPANSTPLQATKSDAPRSFHPPLENTPISPSSKVTSPYDSLIPKPSKQKFGPLMPLAISPPTLRPSMKPPKSLSVLNPTTRIEFSPTSLPGESSSSFQIPGHDHRDPSAVNRVASHSASNSTSTNKSTLSPRSSHHNEPKIHSLNHASISPHLSLHSKSISGPPSIPLRISSIPINSRPRKLSLYNLSSKPTPEAAKSATEDKGSVPLAVETTDSRGIHKHSLCLRTDKELPIPPSSQDEELRTRQRVKTSTSSSGQDSMPTIHAETSSRHRLSVSENKSGQISVECDIAHPGIAELPATSPTRPHRAKGHSRVQSVPTFMSIQSPYYGHDFAALSPHMSTTSLANYPTTMHPITSLDGPSETTEIPWPTTRSHRNSLAPAMKAAPLAKTTPIAKSGGVKSNTSAPVPKDPRKFPLPSAKRVEKTSEPLGQNNAKAYNKSDKKKPMQDGGVSAAIQHQKGPNTRPVAMSRTQRDKDRKKRKKAKIVIDHVDIIKDEFWEKRPWILSGRAE